MKKGIRLGDRVLVKARVQAVKTYGEGWKILRRWEREETQARGVICGMRTVFEGYSEYLSEDAGWVFEMEKAVKTYLVAVNMREIWHVLPEDLEPIGPATYVHCEQYDCLYYRNEDRTCSADAISLSADCVCEQYEPV